MSVVVAKYKITGVSSMLMNNAMSMHLPDVKVKVKKIPTPEEEAASKVYRRDNGTLYAPALWFRGSLLAGAIGKRLGKFSAKSRLAAAVFCSPGEEKCALIHAKTGKPIREYKINTMRSVVQRQGIMRSRPEIEEWTCIVVFEVDTDFVTPQHVEEFLNMAGKIAGVGDYRPQKAGPFGRYKAELLN